MINFLHRYYFAEGPGIPKDAPRATGLRLLGQVLVREWWPLIKLNLICLGFSLPLVTLPAAWFATVSVSVALIEDRNVYVWRDFWGAFRSRFLVSTAFGLVLSAAAILGWLAIGTYAQAARDNLILAVPLAIAISVCALLPLAAAHGFVALAKGAGRPLRDIFRAAVIGLVARPLPGLAALTVVALLWFAHIVFYPASILLPVLVNFSLGALLTTFAVLRGIEFGFAQVASRRRHSAGRPESLST